MIIDTGKKDDDPPKEDHDDEDLKETVPIAPERTQSPKTAGDGARA